MKILITGVAGLLGSRLADYFVDKSVSYNNEDIDVIGVDDLSGGYIDNINKDIMFHEVDVLSKDMESIFAIHSPDIVYHFAAYAAECLSPFIRTYNYTNNLTATANIVNQCIKYHVKRLVFTSSMAVYGDQDPPFNEDMILHPKDPYGVAKAACERDIQIAGEQHGLDWCIIRPHNVYGTKQNLWDRYRNVIGIWMYQKLHDQSISIYGDGQQTRAFSYIDDCLEPFYKCGFSNEASQQIFNIGGTTEYSIQQVAEIVRDVVGDIDIKYFEPRHEVKHAVPTYQKSVELLQYKDKTSLKKGIITMWEWAKSQPMRDRQSFTEYEIEDNIYEYWKN